MIDARADAGLTTACLAAGGFPRAVVVAPGVTVWAGPDGRPWANGVANGVAHG